MKKTLILAFFLTCLHSYAELPKGFVYLSDASPSIVQEIRYASQHNFTGKIVDGYLSPKCILTSQAAISLNKVQKDLEQMGFSLKVYDCYRPQKASDYFKRWAQKNDDILTKDEFYPSLTKDTLFKSGFIASKSGHSRGSTVDLTIIPLKAPIQEEYIPHINLKECDSKNRFRDNSIDMGTGYDCFSPLSETKNKSLNNKQRLNRAMLKSLMEKHGFKNYSKEWWHYSLKNEPFPKTYFNFDIE